MGLALRRGTPADAAEFVLKPLITFSCLPESCRPNTGHERVANLH
jgi:hypothetical protein